MESVVNDVLVPSITDPENKKSFQCSSCSFRTSIKSGTVMGNNNLPIKTWVMDITFVTAIKKGFSAAELQRQKASAATGANILSAISTKPH